MRRRSDSDNNNKVNHGNSRRGSIPIPVSVSLFNLCPISWEKQVAQEKKKFFRPQHSSSLLHSVRLEIVLAPQGSKKTSTSTSTSINHEEEEKVIFSSLAPLKTVNPSWNHLDECIEDYLAMDGYFDSETGESLRQAPCIFSSIEKTHCVFLCVVFPTNNKAFIGS